MRRHRPRIWFGLGAFTLAAGMAADHGPHAAGPFDRLLPPVFAAEEGGEGGERGSEHARIADEPGIVTQLLLMRGHLLAATALFTAGEVEAAKPHLRHPLDALFEPVHEALEERAQEQEQALEAALAEAHAAAEGKPSEIGEAAARALAAIDATVAAVAPDALAAPAFAAAVLQRLLAATAAEYAEAVADGRIVQPEAYQDAWGFFQVAGELWAMLGTRIGRPERVQAVRAKLGEVAQALSDVRPPAVAAVAPDRVRALVSAIDLEVSAFRG